MTFSLDLLCPPLLIGSLPTKNHILASKTVMKYTPEIPLWVQLPYFKKEGIFSQFSEGVPSLRHKNNNIYIDTSVPSHGKEILKFMEDYLEVKNNSRLLLDSRFGLNGKYGKGINTLLNEVKSKNHHPKFLKGQITGPLTFCYGVKDQNSKAIFFNELLREVVTKHLEMNACWQIKKMKLENHNAIIFIDEPILTNFGSANLIGLTHEHVKKSLEPIINTIHNEGAMAGIHVCGNTDWSIILNLNIDIVSFDAHNYLDKFLMYQKEITTFIKNNGTLAWGIVPTASEHEIKNTTSKTITKNLLSAIQQLSDFGIKTNKIFSQSIITPTCGTGLIKPMYAKKVLHLTKKVSEEIRTFINY